MYSKSLEAGRGKHGSPATTPVEEVRALEEQDGASIGVGGATLADS
jgi:hypothetical protein